MTDDEAAALRAAAEAATPGFWVVNNAIGYWIMAGNMHVATIPQAADGDWSPDNAAYIAAASPSVVLALLDEREALRAALEKAEAVCVAVSHYDDAETANAAAYRWPSVKAALGEWQTARAALSGSAAP
ncbi:MAG: ead/Ea22-like family protein [Chloroflexi bacterium]|nr:ead/Ea22-like family protein [Chloroflexota bacterium]